MPCDPFGVTMIDILNPDNAFSGANLIVLLALVLVSTVLFICFSGFVKYNIVLNIIKNAVGTQQIPPSMVVNLLAALMALNSIWPDITPGLERIKPYFSEQQEEQAFPLDIQEIQNKDQPQNITMYYLVSHIFEYFPELLERAKHNTEALTDMIELPLNFDSSADTFKYFLGNLILDLYQGFEMGLKLYMVFVSIDFLIAVVLSGVGMTMLSPTVISTPIKLAIFIFLTVGPCCLGRWVSMEALLFPNWTLFAGLFLFLKVYEPTRLYLDNTCCLAIAITCAMFVDRQLVLNELHLGWVVAVVMFALLMSVPYLLGGMVGSVIQQLLLLNEQSVQDKRFTDESESLAKISSLLMVYYALNDGTLFWPLLQLLNAPSSIALQTDFAQLFFLSQIA